MDYSVIRQSIKSGDVVAFTHRGLKSWSDMESQIVRMATRSEFSHVGILWRVVSRVFCIEAVVPEVRVFPLSSFEEFYLLPIEKELSEDTIDYALSRIGEKYSKLEAIKGYFGLNKNNNSWQCAELVKSILIREGICIPGKDTPTDVVRGLMETFRIPLTLINNRE